MRIRNNLTVVALPIAGIILSLMGCQKSSHSSVRTYEYSDQGRAQQPTYQEQKPREQPSSEYQMVSPGEMASPGEMVAPGRPVVEPRRGP